MEEGRGARREGVGDMVVTTMKNGRDFSNASPLPFELVVFSDDWHGLPFSCKHLVKHFLPDVPVTWADTIGLRSPKLNIYDIRRAHHKVVGWLGPKQKTINSELPANLRIVDPLQVPYNHIALVRGLNRRNLIRAVGPRRPGYARVFLTTWPFLGNLVGRLDEDLSIYYRVDDFSEFPGVRRGHIRALEAELIGRVDLVVGSAETLADVSRFGKIGRYLPHGVDYEHFAGNPEHACALPILEIPRPRIGFFGLLSSWIDFDLVARVAALRPDWSFVFLGPSQLPDSQLPRAPNLHFLGPVPYAELPASARHFDVGLIPFRVSPLTLAVNPLKVMEYFAMGLPVVSTSLPEVMKHGDLVRIADDPEGFAAAIRQVIDRDCDARRIERRTLAQSHGWVLKAIQLRQWIEQAIHDKSQETPPPRDRFATH